MTCPLSVWLSGHLEVKYMDTCCVMSAIGRVTQYVKLIGRHWTHCSILFEVPEGDDGFWFPGQVARGPTDGFPDPEVTWFISSGEEYFVGVRWCHIKDKNHSTQRVHCWKIAGDIDPRTQTFTVSALAHKPM